MRAKSWIAMPKETRSQDLLRGSEQEIRQTRFELGRLRTSMARTEGLLTEMAAKLLQVGLFPMKMHWACGPTSVEEEASLDVCRPVLILFQQGLPRSNFQDVMAEISKEGCFVASNFLR